MNSNGTKLEQVVHTAHQKSCLSGWSRGFGELHPSPQWIPVLAPIYPLSLHGPNIRSHCTKVWHRTYLIYDAPFSRSARRSFAPLQKSCRNFCVCKQERMLQINACVVSLDKRGGRTWRFIVRTSNELSLKY